MQENLEYFIDQLYRMNQFLEGILKNVYQVETIDAISLPIDVERVADFFGIHLVNVSNSIPFISASKLPSFSRLVLTKRRWFFRKKIYVKQSKSRLNEKYSNIERYAIAHEVVKYILNAYDYEQYANIEDEELRRLNLRSFPYLFDLLESKNLYFLYDICTILLLLPFSKFMEEMKDFFDEDDFTINSSLYLLNTQICNFIKKLSLSADIPEFELIQNYGFLRLIACGFYQDIASSPDKEIQKKYYHLYK